MEEKHISVEKDIWAKLRAMAKAEDRTMRAVISRLINEAFDKRMEKK